MVFVNVFATPKQESFFVKDVAGFEITVITAGELVSALQTPLTATETNHVVSVRLEYIYWLEATPSDVSLARYQKSLANQ